MRVAFVYEEFRTDQSLARDRVLVATGLAELGVDVHVYCDPAKRLIEPGGISFYDVSPLVRAPTDLGRAVEYGSFAACATRLLRAKRSHYDVIDVAGTTAWEHDVLRVHAVQEAERRRWPVRGGRGYRLPRLRAAAVPITHPRLGVAEAIERLQFRPGRFRRALAVTDGVKRDLQEVRGIDPNLIDVVAYPVETVRFATAERFSTRSHFGIRADEDVVLFVGHDFARKGLTEAIAGAAKVDRGVHLVVVGDGESAPYAKLAAEVGMTGRVHFAGSTTTPELYFADADVYLLPTREDVWAVSVIEALASGIPVVVTAVAGAAAIVRQHNAGLIIDGSAADAARALTALLESKDEAREMGKRGRAAAAPFDAAQIARHVLRIYRDLAAGLADRQPHSR